MQEIQVQSLSQEDPPEKGMATHSSILAWRIPRQRSLEGYSPWGSEELEMTSTFTAYALLHPDWGLEGGITVVPGRATGVEPWAHVSFVVLSVLGGGVGGGVPLLNFCVKAEEKELWSCSGESSGRGVVLGQLWGKKAEEMASELQVTQSTAWGESQPERAGGRTSMDSRVSWSSCVGQRWGSLSSHRLRQMADVLSVARMASRFLELGSHTKIPRPLPTSPRQSPS